MTELNHHAIVSGEAVALDLPRAGLGSRTIATLIDLAVQFVALFILLIVDANLSGDDAALAAVAIVELVLVFAGYPVLLEWLARGRTLGKMAMGLRVVRDDGGPIGLRQALVRGVTGLVLEKPGLLGPITIALGMFVLGSSPSSKRVGDHLAGTFVVNERTGTRAGALAAPPFWVPYELQGWAMSLDLTRFDDRLALSVRQFVTRAAELNPAARYALENDLANRVAAVIAPAPPTVLPAHLLLTTVLAERRRRADLAAATAPRAAHPGAQFPSVVEPPRGLSGDGPGEAGPSTPNGPAPTQGTGPFTPPS